MDSGHYYSSVFKVTEGNQSNYPVFKNFMDQVMDPIWYESQEFNIEDLEMNELNSLYKRLDWNEPENYCSLLKIKKNCRLQ